MIYIPGKLLSEVELQQIVNRSRTTLFYDQRDGHIPNALMDANGRRRRYTPEMAVEIIHHYWGNNVETKIVPPAELVRMAQECVA